MKTLCYPRNAQGDIVKLIDNGGDTKVEYIYDSWGKVLAVTGSLATSLGENQPFRYRGYVYDSDTNLYYLQSRYYNPSLGRFISNDVYLSTGQGVLGHNSYAYCLNNPLILEDQGGAAAHFNTSVAICDCGTGENKDSQSLRTELERTMRNMGIYPYRTNKVDDVIQRGKRGHKSTIYKGTRIFYVDKIDWVLESSFTPGNCIILLKSELNADTINHEYGHSLQYRFSKHHCLYWLKVAIPSVITYGIDVKYDIGSKAYFSMPWERLADILGGVNRGNYSPGSDIFSLLYSLPDFF